jgi:cytochrome c oxidase subunit IV
MTDGQRQIWQVCKGPATAWLALLVLFSANVGSAYLPLGSGNVAVNLCVAAAMVVILATFLMGLRNSTILLRIIALSGLFWTVIMLTLTFNDYLSRHY